MLKEPLEKNQNWQHETEYSYRLKSSFNFIMQNIVGGTSAQWEKIAPDWSNEIYYRCPFKCPCGEQDTAIIGWQSENHNKEINIYHTESLSLVKWRLIPKAMTLIMSHTEWVNDQNTRRTTRFTPWFKLSSLESVMSDCKTTPSFSNRTINEQW